MQPSATSTATADLDLIVGNSGVNGEERIFVLTQHIESINVMTKDARAVFDRQ